MERPKLELQVVSSNLMWVWGTKLYEHLLLTTESKNNPFKLPIFSESYKKKNKYITLHLHYECFDFINF